MNTFTQLSKKLKIIFIVALLVAIAGIVSVGVLWVKIQRIQSPSISKDSEIKQIVHDLSQYMILPTDESPTIATVTDPSKLQDQPFFAHALAGDKVIVYANARKAILWRPSVKKVVEVSGLNIPTAQAPSPTKTK